MRKAYTLKTSEIKTIADIKAVLGVLSPTVSLEGFKSQEAIESLGLFERCCEICGKIGEENMDNEMKCACKECYEKEKSEVIRGKILQ